MYKKTEIKPSEKLHQTLIGELSELQVRISGYELSQVIKESISLVKKRNYEKALAKVVDAAKNTHDTLNSLLLIQLKLLIQNHIYSIAELSNQKTQPATIKLDDAANPKKNEVQDTDKDKEKTDDAIEKLRYTEIDEEQFSQVQAFLQKHTTTTFKRDQNVVIISWTKVLCLDFENRETPVDNVARDIKQLEHALVVIDFLLKYCNPHHGTAIPVVTALDRFHADMLELWGISLSRDLLEQICQAFYKVSGDTLEKYNKLFIPAPFTWITFEQFGGLIKNKSNFSVIIGALTPPIPGDEHECKKRLYHSAVTRLGNEVKHTNEIIARAVPDIVAIDIPILKKFIEQVIGELRAKRQDSAIRPISLLNIQALTQRIIDNQTYENILSLLQFADHSIYFSDDVSISFGDQSKHSVDLLSPMGRHAALRLLQRLGEYMTGKNLSSCFDDTIPWEDVVALRNIIVHQDQNKNKRFVDDLLKNKEQLETIFKEEFTELFFRLLDNLLLREQNTSTYEMNPQEHWTKIYQLQQQKALAQAAPNQGKKEASVSLTSQEDEDFFIAKLKEKGATEELQDLWRGILRGTEKSPLTSVEEGKFRQKYFPSRKEDPVSCKRLTEIMRNALRPRLNKEERNKKQVQIKEEANQRELEKKNKICGLKTIRSLVEHAKTSQEGGHILSVSERVNAVIEALNNMKQFLFKVGYINYHAAYTTLEGWDAFHMRFGGLTLTNTLLVNHQLRDALEYNFGQAIQHLEKIQGFKVFNNCSYLRQNYPRLRELRNYVEHDNALMATVYSDNSIPFINRITLNEHILYSEYISVIYKLLPELRLVQLERLTSVDRTGNEQNNTSLPVSRLTSSPRSAASSVGSNRFFGAAEQEESDKEKEGYTHTP